MPLDYRTWLNFIFPTSTDERLLNTLSTEEFLAFEAVTHQRDYIALSSYQTSHIRAAIHLVKYHHQRKATNFLAELLKTYLYRCGENDFVIIPVPLSAKRLRERGYNQVTEVAKQTNFPVTNNLLLRTKHTVPQTSLKRAARLTNVANAFCISNQTVAEQKLKGKHIVLLDDVATTGATLRAAKAPLLLPQPASITCIALAH